MVNELPGIQYNIAKANRTDRKVQNLANLVKRMKSGSYRPNPTRRVYIPKETKGKMKPLGISCYEDKLVENAIAQIREQIYEPKFYNKSFGFRSNRNCHQTVREIIEKFLKAGIMEDGKNLDSKWGSSQGNGASPILAKIYLHYVRDNWFDVIVKRPCKGECYLIRYCDDFVCCFQNQHEAKVFRQRLEERFGKYEWELAEEKTKILEFGRFARQNRKARGEGKSKSFDFLGFMFYCGMDGP